MVGISKGGAKTHLPSLMGFAGRVSTLLFLLVAGAVANDQIFTTSGERRGATLDLTRAIGYPPPKHTHNEYTTWSMSLDGSLVE